MAKKSVANNQFDVIVVGAGPSGAQTARELSKSGRSVLIIERSKQVGEPNFSSIGMPDYVIKEFDLPKSVIADSWDKVQIVGPTKEYTWHYPKTRGYVLKFNEFKRFLVKDAIEHGATVYVGSSVTGPILKDGKVIGVTYKGLYEGGAFADIIVDASGPTGVIASAVGIRPKVLSSPSVGLEYILANVDYPKEHVLAFYLGNPWVNHGYAWVFPFGHRMAKVGVGIYGSTQFGMHESLNQVTKNFIAQIPWLAKAQPLEVHGSSLYIMGGIPKHVKDNVLAIGDAAAQINPLGGEGVRHALRSGRMAAETIASALKKHDLTLLENYEQHWQIYTGRKWQVSLILSQVVYLQFDDKLIDRAIGALPRLSADEIYDILFEYDFKKALKLGPKLLPYLPLSTIKFLRAIKKKQAINLPMLR